MSTPSKWVSVQVDRELLEEAGKEIEARLLHRVKLNRSQLVRMGLSALIETGATKEQGR